MTDCITPNIKGYPWDKEKLITTKDIEWECTHDIGRRWESPDGWLVIDHTKWFIKSGFKYDGCTGVSSGPSVKYPETLPVKSLTENHVKILWFACLIHDLCYKYVLIDNAPINKERADEFLKYLCKEASWKYSKMYYIGVSILGWGAITKRFLKDFWDSL